MNTTDKPASNFELNVIKLGVHTLQLHKGDRFESNGDAFYYVPSTAENKGKGKYTRWSGRKDNLSAKKYEKDVLRADNIELISNKVLGFKTEEEAAAEEEARKAEGWKARRLLVYEVKYAYKMELPKNENLVLLQIDLDGKFGEEDKQQWKFKSEELPVERITAGSYYLKTTSPIVHKNQILKTELNNVRVHFNNTYYVFCLMDDYNEQEIALFDYMENAINNKIQSGHDIVRKETNNLNKFLLLKSKQGY